MTAVFAKGLRLEGFPDCRECWQRRRCAPALRRRVRCTPSQYTRPVEPVVIPKSDIVLITQDPPIMWVWSANYFSPSGSIFAMPLPAKIAPPPPPVKVAPADATGCLTAPVKVPPLFNHRS
jgi:hypothetical protein